MTLETFWFGRCAVVLVAVSIAGLSWAEGVRTDGTLRKALRRYTQDLEKSLKFLRASLSSSGVLSLQVVASLFVTVLCVLYKNPLFLGFFPVIAILPQLWLKHLCARRLTRFDEQIEPWLNAIASALKAAPSLGEAIGSTVPLVPVPMSQEIDIVIKEYELGTPLDRALDNLAKRVDSTTLAGTVLALKVARRSGGDLPQMLQNAASVLRELARLEGVVRTKTAQGKFQAFAIGALPVPMLLAFNWIDDRFFMPLLNDVKGHALIGLAGVLWLAAILLARKILAVDV